MKRAITAIAAALVAGMLTGCTASTPGTPRILGKVDYASAFATGREVMAQHFSIASSDPDTGVIEARPKPVEARGERWLGGSPARHLAKMSIRRKDGQIVAHLSVALQREGSAIHRTMAPGAEGYDSVPHGTPADAAAATTPEQNEDWRTEKYDHALERAILDELYKALNPQAK